MNSYKEYAGDKEAQVAAWQTITDGLRKWGQDLVTYGKFLESQTWEPHHDYPENSRRPRNEAEYDREAYVDEWEGLDFEDTIEPKLFELLDPIFETGDYLNVALVPDSYDVLSKADKGPFRKIQDEYYKELNDGLGGDYGDDIIDEMSNWRDNRMSSPDDQAQKIGSLVTNLGQAVLTHLVPKVSGYIVEWNKVHDDIMMTEASNDMVSEGGRSLRGFALASHIYNFSQKAVEALSQATSTKTDRLIKEYASAVREMADAMCEDDTATLSDVSQITACADDMREISSRRFHDDIRGFNVRFVQRDDAKVVMDNLKFYWTRRTQKMLEEGETVKTVPNYRYKIGQMVKVKNKYYGKVIGASKEGGTGKQVYEVAVNGYDKPRKYYTKDLQHTA